MSESHSLPEHSPAATLDPAVLQLQRERNLQGRTAAAHDLLHRDCVTRLLLSAVQSSAADELSVANASDGGCGMALADSAYSGRCVHLCADAADPPPKSAEFPRVLQALRIGHLRRLMQQCLPGGSALLITDIVSTDTAPELFHLPAAELKPFLRKCLQQQNYFRGCHPQRVISDLGILAAAGQKIRRIHLHDPWRWTTGAKAYLVCAVQADLEASG